MKKIIFALCAVACLSACGTPECPDKDVITTTKMVHISKKDTTLILSNDCTYKWHIRDGKVYECIKGEDKPSNRIYVDEKFVEETDTYINYCE